MPALIVSGRSFHYTDSGAPVGTSAAPVIALHSGGLSSRQWSKLAALLAPRRRVLAPDFTGSGASAPWPEGEPYHYSVEVDLTRALLDTVGEPVHLVGHSFGGLVDRKAHV